jgi:predicted DCC family thiol-disulfide oxidoreductase YuxK
MEDNMRSDLPLTVYFDGSCRMCRSELQNIKAHDGKGHLRLVDCSAADFDDAPFRAEGVTRHDMMTRLHVCDNQGAWIKGAPAMELLYRTAGMQRMANLWGGNALLAGFYPWIARHRQALSLTGIPLVFALWARYASWRASRRATTCRAGRCSLDADGAAMDVSRSQKLMERWLLLLAYGHILGGIAIPLLAYSAGFDYYSGLLQKAFWPQEVLSANAVEFQRWIVALFGPTIASVGVVMVYLVKAGISTAEPWPWNAILIALAVWAPGDLYISMMKNFWLHVQIDVAVLALIVPPTLLLRAQATRMQTQANR